MASAVKTTETHPLELLADRYFWNPLGFVQDCFPWGEGALPDMDGPDAWQRDILTAIRDEYSLEKALSIAVSSGHGIGKTALIAWIILWFISTRPHPQIVVTANTSTQLEKKTWRELAKWQKHFEFGSLFEWSATTFRLKEHRETWFASAIPWSEQNSEAFAGTHEKYVLIIFDEASRIADIIWEVAEGAMTTPGAIWIAFGNPTQNTGRFRECFGKLRHRWRTWLVDSRTAKMADKAKIQEWVDDYGEDSDFVRVRVRGVFPRASAMQFIPGDIVEAAAGKQHGALEYSHAAIIIGVDMARYGDDQSVVLVRQGLQVLYHEKHREIDTQTMASRVAMLQDEHQADMIFVDAGYGQGVIDRLRALGRQCVEVYFGSAAADTRQYANKRAEMWGRVKDWLKSGGAIPNDPELTADLVGPEYGFDARDRILLEKKEDMKRRGLASPDAGDALALTFAEIVVKQHPQPTPQPHAYAGGWMGA